MFATYCPCSMVLFLVKVMKVEKVVIVTAEAIFLEHIIVTARLIVWFEINRFVLLLFVVYLICFHLEGDSIFENGVRSQQVLSGDGQMPIRQRWSRVAALCLISFQIFKTHVKTFRKGIMSQQCILFV